MKVLSHCSAFAVLIVAASLVMAGAGHAAKVLDDGVWFTLPGQARDISVTSIGEAYAISIDGTPLRWDPNEENWRTMSGSFTRITGAGERRPWVVDADGDVYRYNGLWWERKDSDVVDVAGNASGEIYIAKADGSIRRWLDLRHSWEAVKGGAKRLALDPAGRLWAVTPDNEIRMRDDDGWHVLPGQARDIAAGINQRVAKVHPDGRVMLWRQRDQQWSALRGVTKATDIAVTGSGAPWVILQDNRILAKLKIAVSSGIEQDDEQTGAEDIKAPDAKPDDIKADEIRADEISSDNPAADDVTPPTNSAEQSSAEQIVPPPTETASNDGTEQGEGGRTERPVSNDPAIDQASRTYSGSLSFTDTRNDADRVAIGRDGSVFALRGGDILRWSNDRRRFNDFPGSLVRLAVDPDGNPWGVSALGRVFRHTGRDWQQVIGQTAADIAIGANGDVITVNAQGRLYHIDNDGMGFTPINGRGVSVAVAVMPDGSPWTILENGLLQYCDDTGCQNISQKASSLAIGSDGTVWIVTPDGFLRRYNSDTGDFETIRIASKTPKRVAAGPQGYPWVVAGDGSVLSSQFFERDESDDLRIAARTSDEMNGSGETTSVTSNDVEGFIFTKNIRFETINTDAAPSGAEIKLAVGNDKIVYGYSYSGGQVKSGAMFTYDERRKRFESEATGFGDQNANILSYDIASNGDIWAYTGPPSVGLFRERNKTQQKFTVSGLTPGGVSVAPDDTVYAIFYTGGTYWLYSKGPNSNTFSRFSDFSSLYDVSVGPGDDVWIVDRDLYVRQWTGSEFEKRPRQGQKAAAVRVSRNGEVFIRSVDNDTYRWNATNKSFDLINNSRAENFDVEEDGRLWLSVDSTPIIKRARD